MEFFSPPKIGSPLEFGTIYLPFWAVLAPNSAGFVKVTAGFV